MKRTTAAVGSTLTVIAILVAVFVYRQPLKDFAVVRTSQLTVESAELLSDLELTQPAEFTYKASRPEILDSAQFNQACSAVAREQSIVLGCYTHQRFFVYNVQDARLTGVKEVTAAHELLHAIYERLSTKEKTELDSLLVSTVETIKDERFQNTIEQYKKSEPDQLANEYHSILGTEIEVLPAKLEAHYQKYFQNRSKIVKFAKQYESAFTSLDQQIKDYDQNLKSLRQEKEQLESRLNSQQASIEAEQERLNRLRQEGNSTDYNAAVPAFNSEVQNYNTNVNRLKQIVEDYNTLVEKRNNLATTQNNLVKQLDSNYQPIN